MYTSLNMSLNKYSYFFLLITSSLMQFNKSDYVSKFLTRSIPIAPRGYESLPHNSVPTGSDAEATSFYWLLYKFTTSAWKDKSKAHETDERESG